MLTKKQHLRYRTRNKKITPVFIDVQDKILTEIYTSTIEILENSIDKTREQIEKEIDEHLSCFDVHQTILNGIKKMIHDQLDYETGGDQSIADRRRQIFLESSLQLKNKEMLSLDEYQNKIAVQCDFKSTEEMESFIFSDLPDMHRLIAIKSLTPHQFLQKYNVSLVQGLIVFTRKLNIKIPTAIPQAMIRGLLRSMKFFQLVLYVKISHGVYDIQLDGPLSIFTHSKKYGLQLAAFFPMLLHIPQWELEAEIDIKQDGNCKQLSLSEKEGLKSHYENFYAYTPAEYKMFQDKFCHTRNNSWVLCDTVETVPFDGERFYFPDYEFVNEDQRRCHMEIFHPWHASQLKERLKNVEAAPPILPLMIAVHKKLLLEGSIATCVENSAYFRKFGYVFREVPLVEPIKKILDFI